MKVSAKKAINGRRHKPAGESRTNERRLSSDGGPDETVNAHYLHAQQLIMAGRYDDAIPLLDKVVDMMPCHTYAFNDLAVIYFQKTSFEKAIQYYRKALLADNGNYNALKNLLSLLKGLGRLDEAVDTVKMLFANRPADEELISVVNGYEIPFLGSRTADSLSVDQRSSRGLDAFQEEGEEWKDSHDPARIEVTEVSPRLLQDLNDVVSNSSR